MKSQAYKQAGSIALAGLLLAGCAGAGRYSDGPDEFMVLPTKPLEMPADLSALPSPTPGGTNLADATPKADGVAALGGRAIGQQDLSGIPAADAALINRVSRYGIDPNLRTELAGNRKSGRGFFLTRWLSNSSLLGGLGSQALDAYAENARLRAAGIKTPSAPPNR